MTFSHSRTKQARKTLQGQRGREGETGNREGGLPGGLLEEVVLFAVNQLGAEFGHLLLHFPHFRVESLADVGEFAVDDAEVAHLDWDIPVLHGCGVDGVVCGFVYLFNHWAIHCTVHSWTRLASFTG